MRDKLFLYEAVKGLLSITRIKIYEVRSDVTVVITMGFEVLATILMKTKFSGMLYLVDW
jgi:hypothetical protein